MIQAPSELNLLSVCSLYKYAAQIQDSRKKVNFLIIKNSLELLIFYNKQDRKKIKSKQNVG